MQAAALLTGEGHGAGFASLQSEPGRAQLFFQILLGEFNILFLAQRHAVEQAHVLDNNIDVHQSVIRGGCHVIEHVGVLHLFGVFLIVEHFRGSTDHLGQFLLAGKRPAVIQRTADTQELAFILAAGGDAQLKLHVRLFFLRADRTGHVLFPAGAERQHHHEYKKHCCDFFHLFSSCKIKSSL